MKDELVLFIGDIHAGSKTALAKKFDLDDGDIYVPSKSQDWLYSCWQDLTKKTKKLAPGYRLILCVGGDTVDNHHHQSQQVFGTDIDQINLAVSLLLPLATVADRVYGLRGTETHTHQSGQYDVKVVEELGGECEYRHRLDVGGKLLDWAHHISTGRRAHTRGNSLKVLGKDIYITALERGERVPDLVVRHHVHLYDDVSDHRIGVRAVTCPGWQLQTAFTRRLDPAGLPSVGGLLWYPRINRLDPILYKVADDPIRKV